MWFLRRLISSKTVTGRRPKGRPDRCRPVLEHLEDRWLPSAVLMEFAVNPNSGSPGTVVQVFGAGFVTGTQVLFHGTPASFSGSQTDTILTVVVPSIPLGSADVKVTNPDGQQAVLPGYFFAVPASPGTPTPGPAAPTITNVGTGSGPAAGGTAVTITGTGFQTGVKVLFGGVAATLSGTPSATSVTALSPALTPGSYDITVLNPDNQKAI
jgi:hypothetical protein